MKNHLYLLMTYFSPSSSSEVAETPFKTLIFLISAHRILSISAEILTLHFSFFTPICIYSFIETFKNITLFIFNYIYRKIEIYNIESISGGIDNGYL